MTELRSFDRSLPMALLQARESVMVHFRPLLAEHGLTEQQWRVIRALSAHESLDASAVADVTNLLAPSVTRILARLETMNLTTRHVATSDQRRSLIELSGEGRALFSTIAPRSEEIYATLEQSFGSERLNRLLQELNDLQEAST